MKNPMLDQRRKSYIEPGEIYFWTATFNKWQRLLADDKCKVVIIRSLQHLSNKGKLDIFAFVVMPNHVHLIWRINEHNGKETTQASFLNPPDDGTDLYRKLVEYMQYYNHERRHSSIEDEAPSSLYLGKKERKPMAA